LNRIIADNNGFYGILYNMSIKHICCHRSLYPLLITFGLVALLGGQGAAADALDDMRLALRDLLQASQVGPSYAAIINFESEPDVSSSTLWIDSGLQGDDELKVTKLPLRHEFALSGRGWKPFIQATLATFELRQKANFFNDPNELLDSKWSSYSASLGGGVRIPLSESLSVLPAVDGGYASLQNDSQFYGTLSNAILKPALEGIFTDWSADAWLANAHLALLYEKALEKVEINAKLSYTFSHIESYRASEGFTGFDEDIGTLNVKVDATYPLGVSLADYPLALIAHLGNSTFVGPNRDAMGFQSLHEAGLSLEMDLARNEWMVEKVSLGAEVLWGDDVHGWSLLFNYRF
jgi:hypothetical protein